MSSLAMYMAPKARINGATPNPSNLNTWLQNNGGYSNCLLVWSAVSKLGVTYQGKTTDKNAMKNYVSSGYGVILNVRSGGHWVLATGHTSAGFNVNDPGFTQTTYGNADVGEAAIYKPISRMLPYVEDPSLDPSEPVWTIEQSENLFYRFEEASE